MYEQYVLDLLSDVFFGGLASHLVKASLLFREIPDLSLWKSQTSHFGNSRPLSLEDQDLLV